MSKKDLWGDIEKTKLPRNPKEILKEQADVIGEKTKYVLKGRVIGSATKGKGSPSFTSGLLVDAIRLDNYTYTLLAIEYPLRMYPLKLHSFPNAVSYTCNNEEEFVEKLGIILSSEEVMKTISALFSQSTV